MMATEGFAPSAAVRCASPLTKGTTRMELFYVLFGLIYLVAGALCLLHGIGVI